MRNYDIPAFLQRVSAAYPAFYPKGAPEDVIEGWALALEDCTCDEAVAALRIVISQDTRGYKPNPQDIAKVIFQNRPRKEPPKPMEPDKDCPRCGGVEWIGYTDEDGWSHELRCVCAGLRLRASDEQLGRGNRMYLGLLSKGRLTHPPEDIDAAVAYYTSYDDLPY